MKPLSPLPIRECPAENDDPGATEFPFAKLGVPAPPAVAPQPSAEERMKQMERMLKEAQGRAETVEREAYDKAYLAGEKAGMQLGKRRAEQLLEEVEESLQHAEAEIATIRGVYADALFDLSRHVCEQIIGDAIEKSPELLMQAVERAARQLPDSKDLRIAVAPELLDSFQRLLGESPLLQHLAPMPGVALNTCRLVTSQQDVLVDPVAAVADYIEQIRPSLLAAAPGTALPQSDAAAETDTTSAADLADSDASGSATAAGNTRAADDLSSDDGEAGDSDA